MSDLIPEITISEFKRLKVNELKQLKSCEITSDGEYLFTYINPNTDYVKIQAEYLAQKSNSIGGKSIDELLAAKAEA